MAAKRYTYTGFDKNDHRFDPIDQTCTCGAEWVYFEEAGTHGCVAGEVPPVFIDANGWCTSTDNPLENHDGTEPTGFLKEPSAAIEYSGFDEVMREILRPGNVVVETVPLSEGADPGRVRVVKTDLVEELKGYHRDKDLFAWRNHKDGDLIIGTPPR